MDIALTDAETKYYNDLFNLCDVEKIGKVPKLKAEEFFRTAENIDNEILLEINQLAGVIPSFLFLNRTQFFSCLRLIGAYQSKTIPLRKEILTSSTIQVALPKFSWKLELEPPPEVILDHPSNPLNKLNQQNGLLASTSSNRSPDLIELLAASKESHHHHHLTVDRNVNSDLPSTDSEMEQTDNERDADCSRKRLGINSLSSNKQSVKTKRSAGGSPNWSTASESPTPTNSTHNSVAERPWASNSQSWQGLLCEEQRQLLGTEEESSDKHSSDEDDDDLDLEALYQITSEQKEYYLKQFRTVQPDIGGLLSGVVAKIFFEKSRIPVEELRHIWQLCDVTRDGALDVAEFTAAMHLVVLRRNNIPIPSVLPLCLQPHILYKTLGLSHKEPSATEVDLLNLESDNDNQESHRSNITQRSNVVNKNEYQRMISSTYDDYRTLSSGKSSQTIMNKSSTLPKNHFSSQHRGEGDGSASNVVSNNTNNLNLNLSNNNNKQMNKNVITTVNRSSSNSPIQQNDGSNIVDGTNPNKEWTKFTESPTSNVSSPGPKPVNVTQSIVSDPLHVIHPVPLRMTPITASEVVDEEALKTFRKADSLVYESGVVKLDRDDGSPKHQQFSKKQSHYQRDSLPNDLRAIQRPHPKKPASKNIGQIPMPPIESSVNQVTISGASGTSILVTNKKEIPPLPPPRPHRHTRSSSLDLQKIKLSNKNVSHDKEVNVSSQPPELPPPRISDKSFKMPSVDTYVEPPVKRSEESFADFTQFPNASTKQQKSGEYVTTIRLDNPPVPQPRLQTTNSLIGPSTSNGSQRTSAFEVYRKPSKSRSSQSPPVLPNEVVKTQDYEKQVHMISENLKQVKFPRNANDQNSQELLKYLKEQNSLLIRLCNDLSDELLVVQKKREEIKGKIDNHQK
ncbi:ralBP1-associated Eps domain-containing protein 1 isoform X2 [Chironomus tepperi]|uniref:ralBP1-associated Eps domain-containing protein 1 isoform X2 n=1 Tax=Chironomus tepperi TaxID=113505 RepID=UPI00391EEF89